MEGNDRKERGDRGVDDAALNRLALQARSDPQAREQLVAFYLELISNWLRKLGYYARGKDTDDLVHDAVVGLLYALAQYDPERGSFTHYAYLRIRSRIVDSIRRRSLDSLSASAQWEVARNTVGFDTWRATTNPLDLLVAQEERREQRQWLDSCHLSRRERQVLALREQGLKPRQIADALGVPRKSVYLALGRLRQKLSRQSA